MKRNYLSFAVVLAALGTYSIAAGNLVFAADGAAPTASPIGKKVENFSLVDFHGNPQSLASYDGKTVVLAFVGTECPLAKVYAPRLKELAAEFAAKDVVFLAIDSNIQDSLADMTAFAREYELTFPLLKDNKNEVADKLGAQRTPEVFLIDKDRVIRYWGRIDDQYGFKTGAGYVRPVLHERHLAKALTEVLAGQPVTQSTAAADGCLIGRVAKVAPHGDITYTKNIASIMQDRCVECHRTGQLAPFTLTSFEDVVGWAEMIREVVNDGRMPPWFANPAHGHFSNDPRLTAEEKAQLFAWIENGSPEGDKKDLPAPRTFAEGWLIGQPDDVFYMANEPFHVPAEGVIPYKFYTVDPGWTEDKWICALEPKPGNPTVVHHIICNAQGKNDSARGGLAALAGGGGPGLGGYAPGTIPLVCPPGTAIHVPAGSKIRFQMHYTTNGTAQDDRSYIGIKYADPATIKKTLKDGLVGEIAFRIPAGAPNYEIKSKRSLSRDTLLLEMTPHMHTRGKSFMFEAEYPDGRRETLLDVPNYDFNWQLSYVLAEPKLLPKGTVIHTTAHFDNSADNPANPDPTRNVTFGEQTWDEMNFGFYTWLDPAQELKPAESASR